MVLWRISNHPLLTGEGGLRASARWHTKGRSVVYCAQSPAAALLEILVHLEVELEHLPISYRLLRIDAPDEIEVAYLAAGELSPDWLQNEQETRLIGDAWLGQNASALLAVPSALVPATSNVLLNPEHPDASRIAIGEVTNHTIDPRLLG